MAAGEVTRVKLAVHTSNQLGDHHQHHQHSHHAARQLHQPHDDLDEREREHDGAAAKNLNLARRPRSSASVSPSSLQSITTDSDSMVGCEHHHSTSPDQRQLDGSNSTTSVNIKSTTTARSTEAEAGQRASKRAAPILIKYNYYDYNGERQENHDMTQFVVPLTSQASGANQPHQQVASNVKPIQRQLSPTFKQSLDQIVRGSQNLIKQRSQALSNSSSPASSPTPRGGGGGGAGLGCYLQTSPNSHQHGEQQPQQHTMTLLARRYKLSSYEHRCLRCSKTVYQMDKVGPLKDFTFYHQNCFKCRECGTKLTLRTYFNNQHSSIDLEVYCHRHCPKTPAGRLDNQSVGIRAALNAPKVFDPIHQQAFDPSQLVMSATAAAAASQQHHQHQLLLMNGQLHNHHNHQRQPQVDSRALHIQHAVQQTRLQSIYKQSQVDKKISQFLNRRLEFLEPKQKMLEMRHREEEEQLFKVFEQKWHHEETQIRDQIRDEWQQELNKLLDKYKRQLSANLSAYNHQQQFSHPDHHHHHQQQQQQQLAEALAGARNLKVSNLLPLKAPSQASESQFNNNNNNNNVNVKLPRIDFHMASGHAVNKAAAAGQHQHQDLNDEQRMIELERLNLEKTMTIKLDRKKETLKRKLKEFERQATAELVEKQSREMLTLISLKLEEFKQEQKRKIGSDLEHFEAIESLANHLGASLQVSSAGGGANNKSSHSNGQRVSPRNSTAVGQGAPGGGELAPPRAPQVSKMELYNSEQADEVFREIDALAINVAREDQRSFTELVHALTRHCLTDVEKVRAIFRWITVKNLNTMHFDATIKADTPLGLLRGIKQGSESYHVLFKRLCSYAGLHCVVIKGFSKSAGYQPGVRFEGNRFRNSWNAVYVAGAWRFVQCNWGARHLVSVAVMQDKNSNNSGKPAGNRAAATVAANVNLGRRGLNSSPSGNAAAAAAAAAPLVPPQAATQYDAAQAANGLHHNHHQRQHRQAAAAAATILSPISPVLSTSTTSSSTYSSSSGSSSSCNSSPSHHHHHHHHSQRKTAAATHSQTAPINGGEPQQQQQQQPANDSLRYEYDDHYFLTDPDEFIYEFFPAAPEWQLLKARPLSLTEFEQLPFVRSLFFKYGLYFPQADIKSVLYTNSSGATTIKIGMPTHMIPSLIFHYNLKYFDSDIEHHEGVSLKRFVMQSVESGTTTAPDTLLGDNQMAAVLSNIVSFRVHVPENGAYILDIFANSTTPTQYITGEPMKFKSVCKFKIIAKNLKTVMVPLPDCASGEYGPMKATRLFGIIPITHENGLVSVQNDKRFLEIQFRMTRPLLDFMASLHKNGYDERQLSKMIKIFIDGDIVFIAIKFLEDGQYGLDIYTRDQTASTIASHQSKSINASSDSGAGGAGGPVESKKQLLTHCCKYLINVRAPKQANN